MPAVLKGVKMAKYEITPRPSRGSEPLVDTVYNLIKDGRCIGVIFNAEDATLVMLALRVQAQGEIK